MQLARKHDVAHLLGLQNEDYYKAVFRCDKQTAVLNEVKALLTKSGIEFIPLKGAVIRDYYPEPWMRTSSDIDILIHEGDCAKAKKLINSMPEFKNCNYYRTFHDLHFESDCVTLEVHFKLTENVDLWNGGSFVDHLYQHTARHFKGGGCGIRPILDIAVLKKAGLVMQCTDKSLEKFVCEINKLADNWFLGIPTETNLELEEYIFNGGAFGNAEQGFAAKNYTIKDFIKNRVIFPKEYLEDEFPVLKKHPWLNPACQVARYIKRATNGHSIKVAKKEIAAIKNKNNEVTELFKDLELE